MIDRSPDTVIDVKPRLTWPDIKSYLGSRVSTLRPPPYAQTRHLMNPFPALRQINAKTWHFILVAFLGWTWDAFDFFSVSLTAAEIAESLDVSITSVSWGITLVLMLRSVGAVIFGLAGDKWGRKWPFIVNLALFIVLELGTGFVKTYKQFLGVRALFGIAMGGLYGNCAATALDDCPADARGFISGLLQQGYAFGYLLCVVFTRAIADTSSHGWRALFWFGAGPPVLIIVYRMMLPETDAYLIEEHLDKEHLGGRTFLKQGKDALRDYWLIFIFVVCFMAGMNFMSHGSQDNFTILLKVQIGMSNDASTVTNSVANLGALCGGIFIGHISQFVGRRLSLIICCILGGAMIYPWAFVRNTGINAAAFFLQFFVQGAWGVVPIYLSELSPPRFRAFLVGVGYQLGNLASSASSTIQTTIGERFPLKDSSGNVIEGRFNYGKVMAIFMGCVFGYVLIISFFGPEYRDRSLVSVQVDTSEKGDLEHVEDTDDEVAHRV